MYVRIVGFLILITLLSGTHWKVYVNGQKKVRAEYTEKLLVQEREYRAKEQSLIQAKQKVEVQYEALKKANARSSASASAELGRLRVVLARPGSSAVAGHPATVPGVDASTIERKLLVEGAEALVGMAAEIDRYTAQLTGLQAYVSRVCLDR